MAKAYQYNATGYYVGEIEDYGGPLPNNATRTAPKEQEGYIPCWNGQKWTQTVNRKGEQGYLDGEPFTVTDYGEPPKGFTQTPPEPTPEEKAATIRAQRDFLITGTDYLMMPDYPIIDAAREEVRAYRQTLRDITQQPGFPESVTWPEKPEALA